MCNRNGVELDISINTVGGQFGPMLSGGEERKAVSSTAAVLAVIALALLAGAGFGLYLTKPSTTSTTTEVMTHTTTEVMTHTEVVNSTEVMTQTTAKAAISFIPAPNVMMAEGIHSAYLIVTPIGAGNWSVEIHAQGLEPTVGTGNVYIVEAQQKSGTMASAPITSQSPMASEFGVAKDGIGQYFTTLNLDPTGQFKSIQIVFLGGMVMSNATVIATATL